MTFGSIFSGIGGLDLGLERAGMTCKWQVEIDGFCQRVLEKHWPDVILWDDVRTWPPTDIGDDDRPELQVDLIAGGFPCQDISQAGTRVGINGKRSGLWKEFARIVRTFRPRYVLVENTTGLLIRGMDRVLGDLAACGYDSEWQSIRASYFSRPHRRERVFIVSYANQFDESAWLGNRGRQEVFGRHYPQRKTVWLETTDAADRMDDGVSSWLYRRGVGSLGNAVVPQVAEWIGRRIIEYDAHIASRNR